MPKTIPIAIRVKPDQIGLALTAQLKQNPLTDSDKFSKIVKKCFLHGLNDLMKQTNTNETSQQVKDILNQLKKGII